MKRSDNPAQVIRNLFDEKKILTINELCFALGQCARMTAFRVLQELGYLSSYSHRGSYYTLVELADFDEQGLWVWRGIRFSRFGTLGKTIAALIPESAAGFTVAELDGLLGVETKHACRRLSADGVVTRMKISGCYVYLCSDSSTRRRQILMREDRNAAVEVGLGVDVELLPDEAKAAIILFYSLLNEKQRRLYAGLEAAKFGYGGDRKIADLFGLDPHTVAKGRQELFGGSVDGSIRAPGGGNRPVEKKRRPSSM